MTPMGSIQLVAEELAFFLEFRYSLLFVPELSLPHDLHVYCSINNTQNYAAIK
jgi:hypothetical protein